MLAPRTCVIYAPATSLTLRAGCKATLVCCPWPFVPPATLQWWIWFNKILTRKWNLSQVQISKRNSRPTQARKMHMCRSLCVLILCLCCTGCATAVVVADVAGSVVVYTGKTIVNTVDVLTPDIVNKKPQP